MDIRRNSHTFAFYYPLVKDNHPQEVRIADADLVHRISRIIRLAEGDRCILFDRQQWVEITIGTMQRNRIVGTVIAWHTVSPWSPSIRFFLPILKRESLAEAVYNLAAAGVQDIQLIETTKVQRTFGGSKELERLERIIIAAAEQSKNFGFPLLHPPITWSDAISSLRNMVSYLGDLAGTPIFTALPKTSSTSHCALIIGPEGDFTPEEYQQLQKAAVIPVQLTPTILTSETAAFYIAALFRSFFMRQ